MFLLRVLARRMVRRAAHEIMTGRPVERGRPERGRFLRRDVEALLDAAWRNLDEMLPEAGLERLPSRGNRQNVFLAVLTLAAYRAFLDAGIERDYAMELFADVGWKVYERFIVLPRWIARIVTRDPQRRMEFILRAMLVYPFNHPGRPGYEVEVRSEPGVLCTTWTHCPPLAFARRWVEAHGDRGELEAFRRSWCTYDWALTYAMVDGAAGQRGHYERPHTLSAGDAMCDMRWSAADRPGAEPGSAAPEPD